jgi:hypothetical protein
LNRFIKQYIVFEFFGASCLPARQRRAANRNSLPFPAQSSPEHTMSNEIFIQK